MSLFRKVRCIPSFIRACSLRGLHIVFVALFAFSHACAGKAYAASGNTVYVVVSFPILADMVKQVGGEFVSVESLMLPDTADFHTLNISPKGLTGLSKAQLFIVNGLSFENWTDRVVQASGYRGSVVVASKGEPQFCGGKKISNDPHAWMNPVNALLYVENIKNALCKSDPAHCNAYSKNASGYSQEIMTLIDTIRNKMVPLSPDQRRFYASHSPLSHFECGYGVEFTYMKGFSGHDIPSASALADLQQQMKKESIKKIIMAKGDNKKNIDLLARETGLTVAGTIYVDTFAEDSRDKADSYLGMMRYNLEQLLSAGSKSEGTASPSRSRPLTNRSSSKTEK